MVTLLVVEDLPDMQRSIINLAREAGIPKENITVVADKQSAMDIIHKPGQKFDMAVVGLSFTASPEDLGGLDVIRALKRKTPNCRVIGLTTSIRFEERGVQTLNAGADDFVPTKILQVNWAELLLQRIKLHKGVIELRQQIAQSA